MALFEGRAAWLRPLQREPAFTHIFGKRALGQR
jgi:hypothetical protein